MGISDVIWMVLVIAGAVYILYRSIWKKKGHCPGCDSQECDMEEELRTEGRRPNEEKTKTN